ncbi:MAG TPA: NAD(P)/FAD-dependent oxidoreductase [Ferruginibacter sp.]|nr:NAD(P)/FAD-dependent oxidoreductase [Ferruginibacter sp.]HQW83504.1 NAD(P)/FAD-dependent oxidoreductase [Ferruginibacter sp.]
MEKTKRIVIVGGGFAGLHVARKLHKKGFEVYVVDKNNYHQFQPLFYQVATAGLEPANIVFPLRKAFHHYDGFHIRMAELIEIIPSQNKIITTENEIKYDYLVIATGVTTNFFGNKQIEENAIPMKTVSEALYMRNRVLQNLEDVYYADKEERERLRNIVIVGGGPTGVEVSGAIADMRKYVLRKDYPELDFSLMNIFLIEGSPALLGAMSKNAQKKSQAFLEKMGVNVFTNTVVKEYDGKTALLSNGTAIATNTLIWGAGVTAQKINGIPAEILQRGNRIKVNRYNQAEGFENIFVLGDIAYMTEEKYPNAHPQVASVAIAQGKLLAQNLVRLVQNKPLIKFEYKDKGSMATVGRKKAVVDLPYWKFQGAFAWHTWNLVHLFSILGVKNKLSIFFNWAWNYFSPNPNLRVLIKPFIKKK